MSGGERTAHLVDTVIDGASSITAVLIAKALIVAWLIGLVFVPGGFRNNNYQLLINTATTIITFLLGFYILASTSRDARALHTKVDALIAANQDVSSRLVGLESGTAQQIKAEQAAVRGEADG